MSFCWGLLKERQNLIYDVQFNPDDVRQWRDIEIMNFVQSTSRFLIFWDKVTFTKFLNFLLTWILILIVLSTFNPNEDELLVVYTHAISWWEAMTNSQGKTT